MKALIIILATAFCIIPIGISIYGLILAFKASLVLGVLVLLLEPTPFIIGVIGLFGHPEVASQIAKWIGL